jgi:hypothetical protein
MPENTGDTRFEHRAGSGADEPKRNVKKEQESARRTGQGGDQTRVEDTTRDAFTRPDASDPGGDRSQGKQTRGHDEVATRRHLEGSEQGPQ